MNTTLRITVSLLLLASAAAGAAGRSYRWTDAQGKLHFGDVPPSNATNVVETAAPPPSLSSNAAPTTAANALSADECQRKQKQLDGYQSAASITETDGLGNRRDYTDDERKKLIERTQKAISDGCPSAY